MGTKHTRKVGDIMDERTERVVDALKEVNADWAVLTGRDTICYATGHPVSIEWGISPFAGGANFALVGRDGQVGLVLPNHEKIGAEFPGVDVQTYIGFDHAKPENLVANYRQAVTALIERLGVSGKIAVERQGFSAMLSDVLSPTATVDINLALSERRATKTHDEIAALTRAAQAAAQGQDKARAIIRPGMTELEAFAHIRLAMESFAEGRCAIAGDFMTGIDRTAVGMAWPSNRMIQPNDPILCDLAPRVDGIWGDSCNSFVLGEPSNDYLQLFTRSKEALTAAETLMVPGKPIATVDAELRAIVEVDDLICHHHMGHGIGTSVHEWPRVIPNETTPLREGMVLMIEPGSYRPGIGGVRLEYMMLVTQNGARPLFPFEQTPSVQPA